MRGLAVLLAAAVASLSSHAAVSQDWFNGGIGSGWPQDASMFGGEWCEDAEDKAQMSGDALQIATDEDDPLVFEADAPKYLGTDDAATNVTISFTSAFMPYSLSVLPSVPDDAKGAVILVTEEEDPEEASGGEFYYAAYDSDSGANGWKPSGVTAATTDFVGVTMLISHDDSDFISVKYTINGKLLDAVPFKQSDAIVHDVVYAGVGQASELKSTFKNVDPYRIGDVEYADFESLKAAMRDGDTVIMQLNDTLSAGSTLTNHVTFVVGRYVLSGYLTNAADAEFTANAASNLPLAFFIRADRTLTLPDGTAIGDYSLSGEEYAYVTIGVESWVRYGGQWRKMDLVTMNFYYPGYFDCEKVTLRGPFGGRIEDEELDLYVDDVNEADYVQKFYWDAETDKLIDYVYWFDGTWRDAAGILVDFPTRYVAGDFYPNSTAILFRISYDMGEAGSSAVNDPKNPTGYKIVSSSCGLGEASAPGLAFLGWTNATGQVVTEIDPVALGRENGYLEDITLFAVWEKAVKSTAVKLSVAKIAPGETAAYYDTDAAALSAAAAINDDKADSVLAPAGFTGDESAYAANFAAAAEGTAISVVLTDEAAAKIAERLNNDVLVAAELADPTVATVTITDAEPGFYYSIVGGTTLDSVTTEGVRKLAQGATVELEKPNLEESNSAFYRIRAAVK